MKLNGNTIVLTLGAAAVLLAAFLFRSWVHRGGSVAPSQVAEAGLPAMPPSASGNPSLLAALGDAYHAAVLHPTNPIHRETLAYLYHANGYFQEAISTYQDLLDSKQDRPAYLLALAHLDLGNHDEALAILRRLLANGSDYPLVPLRLGDTLLKSDQAEPAMAAYQRCLELDPDNLHAMVGLAQGAIRRSDWPTALDWLEKAIEQDASLATSYALLAQVYQATGEDDKRERALRLSYLKNEYWNPVDPWYQEMITGYCHKPYQLLVFAEMADAAGQDQLAQEALDQAAKVAPANPQVLVELGRQALITGDFKLARSHFQQAIESNPRTEAAYIGLAKTYSIDGDLDRAISIASRGLSENPKSSNLYSSLGELRLEQRDADKARQAFERAFQLNPMGLTQMRNLGSLLFSEGDPRGAKLLSDYLTYQPDDQDVAAYYAQALLRRNGSVDSAVEVLKNAIESVETPDQGLQHLYAAALQQKSRELIARQQFERAASFLEQSLDTWPDNPEGLANLGMLQAQIGQHDRAKRSLTRFTEMQPENALAWLNLGKARLLADDVQEARAAWKRGLALAQANRQESARQELRQLLQRFAD